MTTRRAALAVVLGLAASTSGTAADPIDDLRWYQQQPISRYDLALWELEKAIEPITIDRSLPIGGWPMVKASLDEISITVYLAEEFTSQLCVERLMHIRFAMFGSDEPAGIIDRYSSILNRRVGPLPGQPDSLGASMAQQTDLVIFMGLGGVCHMPLLGDASSIFSGTIRQ